MELREQLEDARDEPALDAIDAQAAQLKRDMLTQLAHQIDAEQAWPAAAQSVRALMFLDKLAGDVDRRRETLEQGS